jgi:glycosyltransferase involved in cell wall biosynthesis
MPTSKQHIMNRLPYADILYFDPPVTRIAPLKDPKTKPRLSAYKKTVTVKDGLRVLAMPPVMPFFNKKRWINRYNQKKLAAFVNKKIKEHGFEKPVLWVYTHTAADLVPHIEHSAVVYHCVDRHNAYPGLINAELVDEMERDLCAQANVVFATAEGLYERLQPWCKNIHLIPNGVDFERFNPDKTAELPKPDDMAGITAPVFGFVGMLQPCIDLDLIESAAKSKPKWSFVIIGEPLPGVDTAALAALENVHLLGFKSHENLPAYLRHFDVCLNLFRSGGLAKDVSPLKFYEYLATGKPIVSTPQPDQVMNYTDVIHVSGAPETFITACQRALQEDGGKAIQRTAYAKTASWDARVAVMEKILIEAGVF